MKIGKYISELLFSKDNVILPGFGEFSTKYIPARFVPEKKKVEAPSKQITFSTKNKTDDKVLTEHIAKKENISVEKAKDFIDSFVKEMNNSLKSGKKVELEEVGQFSMSPAGEIEFVADKSVNYLDDTAGMRSVKEPEKKAPEAAKTEADKVLDKAEDAKKGTEKKTPEAAAKDIKPGEEKKDGKTIPPPPIQPIKQKSGLPPAAKWVAFLVVPLLVIIILIAVNFEFLFGDKAIDILGVFDKKPKTEIVEPVDDISGISDETQEAIEDVEETETTGTMEKSTTPEPGRKVYYIIVGSFEEEHNAEIYADELRSKGAPNAKAFPMNRLGFYRVAYDYYYDLNEAEQMLQTVQQTVSSDAWVLHR